MGRKYKDGDGKPNPVRDIMLVGCCDCGLVHRHIHSIRKDDGVLMVQVLRDNRATAQLRRHMARDGRFFPHPESNVYILPLRIQRKRVIKRVDIKIEPGDPNDAAYRNSTLHNSRAPHAARGKGNDCKRTRAAGSVR